MVANERSEDQFCKPNWKIKQTKFILFVASRLVAGKIGDEAHEQLDAMLLVGSKDNCL